MLSIVSFAMGVVLLFIHFLVSPKLSSLYSDLGATPSFITQNSKPIVIFLSLILFFFGYTVATSESITRNFEEKLRQYNDDSMIKTTDLIFTGHEAFLMILIGLAVGFLVSSIILPIYNLTSVV
jgi:type II secretory pathway component PulF